METGQTVVMFVVGIGGAILTFVTSRRTAEHKRTNNLEEQLDNFRVEYDKQLKSLRDEVAAISEERNQLIKKHSLFFEYISKLRQQLRDASIEPRDYPQGWFDA